MRSSYLCFCQTSLGKNQVREEIRNIYQKQTKTTKKKQKKKTQHNSPENCLLKWPLSLKALRFSGSHTNRLIQGSKELNQFNLNEFSCYLEHVFNQRSPDFQSPALNTQPCDLPHCFESRDTVTLVLVLYVILGCKTKLGNVSEGVPGS